MIQPRRVNLFRVLHTVYMWYQTILAIVGVVFLVLLFVVLFPTTPRPLKDAIRFVDVKAVQHHIGSSILMLPTQDHPIAYYLTEMMEDSSAAAAQILKMLAVKNFMGRVNDHVTARYHPLTCAYRQQRYQVAKALLDADNQSPTGGGVVIPEVYASYLDCRDIQRVDSKRVTLVVFMGERRDCVLQYPSTIPFAASRLHHHLETRGLLHDTFDNPPQHLSSVKIPPRRVPPRGSPTLPAGAWDSPFFPPPVGILPALSDVVMNPACFEDLLGAIRYYYIGGAALAGTTGGMIMNGLLWIVWMGGLCAVMLCLWTDGLRVLWRYGRERGRREREPTAAANVAQGGGAGDARGADWNT